MRKELARLSAQQENLLAKVSPARNLIVAYNEFFADAFAVVWVGNPRAASENLNFTARQKRERERDFSKRRPLYNVTDFVPPALEFRIVSLNPDGVIGATNYGSTQWGADSRFEAHTVFDPARSYFWSRFASSPPYAGKVGLLMGKLFEAIRLETDERRANPALMKISPREMNRRLIEKMDLVFSQP